MTRPTRQQRLKRIAPYRSRYEFDIATNLKRKKAKFDYEKKTYRYSKQLAAAVCDDCGSDSISDFHNYTPDFIVKASGIIIEAKGRFLPADRKKVLAVLESNNDITRDNFRMLFMQNKKLSPKSKSRYGDWCDKNNIQWDIGPEVPEEWLQKE